MVGLVYSRNIATMQIISLSVRQSEYWFFRGKLLRDVDSRNFLGSLSTIVTAMMFTCYHYDTWVLLGYCVMEPVQSQ